MGRKISLRSVKLINAGDMSGSITSAGIETTYLDNVGILIEWTGTSPVGVITVEVKNGESGWSALDFGSPLSVSGNTGSMNINVNETPFEYLRLAYARSSGTGTISAHVAAKVVGA